MLMDLTDSNLLQELPSDNEDSGPPSMAPPPLPADYTGGMGGMGGLGGGGMASSNGVSSASAAANSNMGWNMAPPPASTQPGALVTYAYRMMLLRALLQEKYHVSI